MMYLQLAFRYASRRLVNYIAIAALALALAVQIVAMSVLDGMLVDLEKRLRNLGEQITLRVTQGPLPGRELVDTVADEVRSQVDGVIGLTPLIQRAGFLESGNGAEYAYVQGIDLGLELAYSSLPDHLLTFKPDPRRPDWGATGDRPGMFMGEQLARRLAINPGDEIDLYRAERGETGEIRTRAKRFVVTSLYRSGVFEKDRYGVYVPIDEAADFYLGSTYPDARDKVETMVVWLADPDTAEELEDDVAVAAGDSLFIHTQNEPAIAADNWQRRWTHMAQGMKHENNLMELVLFLNDAASGFCVFAILVTLVSRRIRDVGLLRCIGAGRAGVMTIFLLVGLMIGVTGGILGVAAGTFLAGPTIAETVDGTTRYAGGGAAETPIRAGEQPSDRRPRIDRWYEAVTGQPLYPPRMFGVADEAGLPTVVYPWKLALYFIAAVVVSVLAAVYPAAWAACREPMSALREG
ncbi:MAG: ABC transporter permease [Planctomycetaceae bacterium]|nr:ABC transporter permease [Planctomycetaceae bacterium]